ncbi:MAG: hypothetical protein KC544_00865 [Gemmatimonadetes bacterium]|nr:hypothetical protein [Gemmatimonadota bacterium]MCB9505427.1 hypothetical protein [Gemmatimonadales bacterium]MCA9761660.1 hypothetical protein [Gemmatimonadota bacterium]MCB9518701.1 hypothetical protein [Gemmatimonadales bacterium]HPF60618.1 hypothetical protein [Gemmatimonadales bacterium]
MTGPGEGIIFGPVHFRAENTLMRRLVPLALVATLAACPTYDSLPYVSSQDGLMDADAFAAYGPQQAIAVAIGREFAEADAARATEYAKKFPQVTSVEADSLGHRLVVTFADHWSTQVVPITDGKSGDETAGLPK